MFCPAFRRQQGYRTGALEALTRATCSVYSRKRSKAVDKSFTRPRGLQNMFGVDSGTAC